MAKHVRRHQWLVSPREGQLRFRTERSHVRHHYDSKTICSKNQFLTTSCWNYLKTTVWLMTLFKSLKTRNPKMPLSTTCSTQQMVVSGCRPFGYRWGAAPWRNDPKHRQETQLGTAAVTRWSVNFTPGGDDLHSTSTCGLRISSRWIVFGHDIPAARH